MSDNQVTENEQSAIDFITDKAKFDDDKGRFNVGKADYYSYGDSRGVPKDMFTAVTEVNRDLAKGAIHVAADRLAEQVKTAVKNNEDPRDLEFKGTIQTAEGKLEARVMTQRVRPVPARQDAEGNVVSEKTTVTKNGPSSLSLVISKAVKRDAGEYAENKITEALGNYKPKD